MSSTRFHAPIPHRETVLRTRFRVLKPCREHGFTQIPKKIKHTENTSNFFFDLTSSDKLFITNFVLGTLPYEFRLEPPPEIETPPPTNKPYEV